MGGSALNAGRSLGMVYVQAKSLASFAAFVPLIEILLDLYVLLKRDTKNLQQREILQSKHGAMEHDPASLPWGS